MADDVTGKTYNRALLIEELLDSFEKRWGAHERPDWRSHLPEDESLWPKFVPELIRIDCEYRRLAGEVPKAADYGECSVFFNDDTLIIPKAPKQREPRPAAADSLRRGRFQIVQPHAEGGLGQVSLAQDDELQRTVALKEIKPRYADDPDCRRRFVREGAITARLEHPGIVPVYGRGEGVDGRPFYAMRFVQGESLKQTLEKFHDPANPDREDPAVRQLALRQLLTRFIAVCHAIEYAHSQQVVHRDLKPANIMLGSFGETLVVDWGLAKSRAGIDQSGDTPLPVVPASASEVETVDGATVGTPQYMSPEQAVGEPDKVGPAADIYGLGATLYHLLCGRPPFSRSPVDRELLARIQSGQFAPPRTQSREVPRPLEAVCLKAMAVNPADRYATARLLADDIEHWLADEPVSAQPETVIDRWSRFARKHRGYVRAGAVGLVLLSLGAICATLVFESQRREGARLEQALQGESIEKLGKSAELLAQRGDWNGALELWNAFDARLATTLGVPVDSDARARIQIERAIALWGLNRGPEGDAILSDLRKQQVSDQLQPRLLLWSGVQSLGKDQSGAMALLRQVAKAQQGSRLSNRELQFAEALTAPDTTRSVESLQAIIREDPFFPGAQQMLIVMLIIRGERQQAHTEIELAHRQFPKDPNIAVCEAMLLGFEKSPEEIGRELPPLLGLMPEHVAAVVGKLVPWLAEKISIIQLSRDPVSMRLMLPRLPLWLAELDDISRLGNDSGMNVLCLTPALVISRELLGSIMNPVGIWNLTMNTEPVINELIARNPVGELLAIRGTLLRLRGELRQAEESLNRADHRTLLPATQAFVLNELALVQFLQANVHAQQVENRNESARQRFVATAGRCLTEFANQHLQMDAVVFETLVNNCWQASHPDLGLRFIELWESQHPPHPHLLRLRGNLYLSRGELTRALSNYEQALKTGLVEPQRRMDVENVIPQVKEAIRKQLEGALQ